MKKYRKINEYMNDQLYDLVIHNLKLNNFIKHKIHRETLNVLCNNKTPIIFSSYEDADDARSEATHNFDGDYVVIEFNDDECYLINTKDYSIKRNNPTKMINRLTKATSTITKKMKVAKQKMETDVLANHRKQNVAKSYLYEYQHLERLLEYVNGLIIAYKTDRVSDTLQFITTVSILDKILKIFTIDRMTLDYFYIKQYHRIYFPNLTKTELENIYNELQYIKSLNK